jgi:hypothetical protein
MSETQEVFLLEHAQEAVNRAGHIPGAWERTYSGDVAVMQQRCLRCGLYSEVRNGGTLLIPSQCTKPPLRVVGQAVEP